MIGEIDHIEIEASDAEEMADCMKKLGFEEVRRTEHHGLSIEVAPVDGDGPLFEIHTVQGEEVPGINHIAYKVDSGDDLFDAASAMRERGIPTDGFGQHSISRGKFCYARDPVSDHTIEFNAGGYLVFDPNWEPVRWREDDLEDRPWIGAITGGVNVPYS